MVTVYDVPPTELIEAVKEELKKNEKIKAPDWALFAKSGAHKERPPQQDDFWYIRAASLLRKIYVKGPVGVSRLSTEYGGKKNRGSQPEQFRKGSGSIARELMQQLESAGYVKQIKSKGRVVTPAGQKFLDNIAYKVSKAPKAPKPEPRPEPKEEKVEEKKEEPKAEPKTETPKEESKPEEKPEAKEQKPEQKLKEEKTK